MAGGVIMTGNLPKLLQGKGKLKKKKLKLKVEGGKKNGKRIRNTPKGS